MTAASDYMARGVIFDGLGVPWVLRSITSLYMTVTYNLMAGAFDLMDGIFHV